MISLSNFGVPTDGRELFVKGSALFLTGITLGVVLFSLAGLPLTVAPEFSGHPSLLKFSSYEELKAFLNGSLNSKPYSYMDFPRNTLVSTPFSAFSVKEGGIEHSQTNIQVEGVDEADIVKSDGQYLYLASGMEILIVKAYPPETARVVSRIRMNGAISGIFVNENKLVVFANEFPNCLGPDSIAGYGFLQASVKVYNIENRENPVLTRSVTVNGTYFNSRMIGKYAYILLNSPAYLRENEVCLPSIMVNGRVKRIEASSIYYSNVSDYYYSFTTVVALNIMDDEEDIAQETFLFGSATSVYVSLSNIYVAIPKYGENGVQKTEIHRIQVQDGKITYVASGEVPGRVLNQFSMDEYNGYFRIATTTGHVSRFLSQATSMNHVYTLNMSLNIIGRLENLAPGEKIYSARFVGERCYLVTFKKVDPLFVISLEDPEMPVVLGQLKIPGYSDYLHPYDGNHLIGIGKWTVEAEEGDFAWYQGLKISLFDVSDLEHPMEIDSFIIGDRGTDSPVLSDHKALLFDKARNLLAFPVLVAEIDEAKYPKGVPPNTYGDYVWQGLFVFNITERGITLRGGITHVENEAEFLKSGYYFSSEYSVQRALYIDDVLYTISNKKIKMNDLATLQEINEIELP
ncbi:MAG: beta-propeller domain-containing protein [Nitrososphaerota archaeon]